MRLIAVLRLKNKFPFQFERKKMIRIAGSSSVSPEVMFFSESRYADYPPP